MSPRDRSDRHELLRQTRYASVFIYDGSGVLGLWLAADGGREATITLTADQAVALSHLLQRSARKLNELSEVPE